MKKLVLTLFLSLFTMVSVFPQEKGQSVTIGGYASWLHNSIFDTISGPWINTGMLHNRINIKAYAGKKMSFGLEIRNRFVTGDVTGLDLFYRETLDKDPGWADMSWNLVSEESFIFNCMIDRAWVEFTAGKLQVTAGRQRINWSQTLVWNPNDIFNTYSFFDFDYIERPGSDALRTVYSVTPSSAAEAAIKVNKEGKITAAALYRFSVLNTDIQLLAGETDEDNFVAGAGWSAAIGSFSVRGEGSWFLPFENNTTDDMTLIVTLGVDKSFSDKVTAVTQLMYCNNPFKLILFGELYGGGLSPSELAFSKYTAMGQVAYTPMPLITISGSAMWYPDLDGFFAGPSLDFSMAENIDFSLIWQHFKSTIGGVSTRINLGFLRFKYSF